MNGMRDRALTGEDGSPPHRENIVHDVASQFHKQEAGTVGLGKQGKWPKHRESHFLPQRRAQKPDIHAYLNV